MDLKLGTTKVATVKDPEFTLEDLEKPFEEFEQIPQVQPLSIKPIHIVGEIKDFTVYNDLAVDVGLQGGVPIIFMDPGFLTKRFNCKAVLTGGRIYIDEMARYWFYCQIRRAGGKICPIKSEQ